MAVWGIEQNDIASALKLGVFCTFSPTHSINTDPRSFTSKKKLKGPRREMESQLHVLATKIVEVHRLASRCMTCENRLPRHNQQHSFPSVHARVVESNFLPYIRSYNSAKRLRADFHSFLPLMCDGPDNQVNDVKHDGLVIECELKLPN